MMDIAKRTHIGELNEKLAGKSVHIQGWVDTIRGHGKLVFLDLRDISGIVQCVIAADKPGAFEIAKKLSKESCIGLVGKIALRPKNTINEKIPTGRIELDVEIVEAYTICPPLPFELEGVEVGEEVRLKYRYLDLRRKGMQRNLILR